MGQKIEEQISALLDAELPVEEEELLLRRLEQDPEHTALLGRYSLIGELLRDVSADVAALQIGERVRVQIAAETTHAGIARSAGTGTGGWKSIGKFAAGAGIAAAIAAIALTTVVDLNSPSSPGPVFAFPAGNPGGDVIAQDRLTNYLVAHRDFSSALSRHAMDSRIVRHTPADTDWRFRTIADE
jgi:hypothetical protein